MLAVNISANPIRFMRYVPYNFCKTCHVMFALHVYDLTFILGVRWDSGRECISRFHKHDAVSDFEGDISDKNRHFKPIYDILPRVTQCLNQWENKKQP